MVDANRFRMLINGQQIEGEKLINVINPATEKVFAKVPDATFEQLNEAVASAKAAFSSWSMRSTSERQKFVADIGKCIEENSDELSRLFTREMGRPIEGAYWEMGLSADWCKATAKFDLPVEIVEDTSDHKVEIRHIPIGVVGAIIPWNAPILIAIWKIAPALLAGNTVVLKPSPTTPVTTLRLGELLQNVLPAGVLNIVTGGNELGQWITNHPDIGKVSFTGSTLTGKKVMESASKTLKRVTLELGGNDAAIVLPDVDPEKVAPELFWGAFFNSAQVCVAAKRLYIHESIYDDVAHHMVEYAKNIMMGDGSEQGIGLGPVQNKMQFEKVSGLIRSAKEAGLQFLIGGDVSESEGYFIPVTLVDNPPEDSDVVVEEAFGPVLPLLKYSDIDEVIERANNSNAGLAGSIWSKDIDKAREIAARLETGTVWINEMFAFSPTSPFGGHKQSGIGSEHGLEGLLEYTNTQTITVKKKAMAS